MTRRSCAFAWRLIFVPLLCLVSAIVSWAPAGAAGECGTVVASGLANPRAVAVAADGTVYVSESGTGGPEQIARPAQIPPGPPVPPTRGLTGQITRLGPGGAKTVVAGNLPSYGGAEGGNDPTQGATGPAGLVAAGEALRLVTAGPGLLTPFASPSPNEGSILRIDPRTGAVSPVADVTAFERASNPDGLGIDSNPYGLAAAPNGTLYVADAGGNDLLQVNPTTRQISLMTVFEGLPIGQPNPGRGGRSELDPVPTGVALGTDGSVYVGLLSGAPYPAGAAKVVRVAPDGGVQDFATGLTAVVGLAMGPDRMLYVSEIFGPPAPGGPPGQPGPGRIQRVMPHGQTQVVADGLLLPNGMAFDRAGNLYVVTGSATTQGQVLRCDRLASIGLGLPRTGTGPAPGAGQGRLAWGLPAAGAALAATFFLRRRPFGGRP